MVLKQLELFRYKQFKHACFTFQPGFNVIWGPNESGKTTLREALLLAFFGNPTTTSDSVRSATTWGQTEPCEVRLEYLDDAGVLCQLRKDFAGNKIFLLRGEEQFRTYKTIQSQVLETLGLPSEDLFRLCASLDVRSLANLGSRESRKQTGQMLAGLMTGASSGQDALTAIKRLEDALRLLGKGERAPAKDPGPLKAAREQLLRWQARQAEMAGKQRDRQDRETRWASATLELNALRERTDNLNRLLAANEKLSQADRRRQELILRDAEYEKADQRRRQWQEELERLDRKIEAESAARCPAAGIEELKNLLARKAAAPSGVEPALPADRSAWILLASGAILALAGSWLIWQGGAWAGWLLVLAGLGTTAAGWAKKRNQHAQTRRRQTQTEEAQTERAAQESRIKALCEPAGALPPEALLQSWERLLALRAEREALARSLAAMGRTDPEPWQAVRRELRLVEDVLADPELNPLRLAPAELAARQREREAAVERLKTLETETERWRVLQEQDARLEEGLAEAEEQAEEIRRRIAYLERRERVLKTTLELLDQARRDTLHPARQVLEKQAGELWSQLSEGRYKNIAIDDEDLSSKIFIPETSKWEGPEVLSQGAFDQFFLSLRLALTDALSGGRKPPLFLDEPLSAFDPERERAALDYLRSLSASRQILFFSCRPEYAEAAEHVVQLPSPDGKKGKETRQ
ncbi:MAG: AAA family ATPase [candidate division FCPU426 bacterium]